MVFHSLPNRFSPLGFAGPEHLVWWRPGTDVVSLAITDLEGNVKQTNPRFCELVGYSAEELSEREDDVSDGTPLGLPGTGPDRGHGHRSDRGRRTGHRRHGPRDVAARAGGHRLSSLAHDLAARHHAPARHPDGRYVWNSEQLSAAAGTPRPEPIAEQLAVMGPHGIRKETNGEMCDVVVDVSGNPNAILKSVDCLHRQSTLVLGGLTGDTTVTPMLMDKLVWNEIKLQGCFTADNDATEAALRLIEETKFPVQEMVSHTFPLKEIEKCIRAVGGEIPEMFPTKALINPALG